jgi:hypothetical protein
VRRTQEVERELQESEAGFVPPVKSGYRKLQRLSLNSPTVSRTALLLSPVSGGRPSEDEVQHNANSTNRPWQSCISSGFDLSDGSRCACLATSELLPPHLHLVFFGGALYRDASELGPPVDLAIPLRILSHGISVRGNGCCPESPAGGMLLGMLGTIGPSYFRMRKDAKTRHRHYFC